MQMYFISDTESGNKRHTSRREAVRRPDGRAALAAMVQAAGVRLSPAIDREEQTTNRVRKLRKKVKLLTNSRCAETSG